MSDNYTKVQQAFRILHPQLAGYVCQELRREYQDNWWQEVLMTLSDQTRDLPDDNGDYATLMDRWTLPTACVCSTASGTTCSSANCPSTTAPGPRS